MRHALSFRTWEVSRFTLRSAPGKSNVATLHGVGNLERLGRELRR